MRIVDSAIHNEVPGIGTLMPYLPPHWVEQFRHSRFAGPFDFDSPFPANSEMAVRSDRREGNGPPGLGSVREQVLDRGVDTGILLCSYAVDSLHNPDQAIALARAVNDWQISEWLDPEPRLRASVVVPSQLAEAAAAEIERVGHHPGFVQVALPARSQRPYGSRIHHPMWEAALRHNLVAGIYFGGAPGNPPTAVGWPSYFIEEYVAMSSVFAAQVTSLVVEGTFDRFPALRVTMVGSGVSWLPSHMWRFDKEWKNLRLQVPWVRRRPSLYIRDHMRFTTEPWDAPPDDERQRELFEELGSDQLLMYASGYPHLETGEQNRLLRNLKDEAATAVQSHNARHWYDLRPARLRSTA